MRRSDPTRKPWIIGHRGASGLRPEHTLAAYALAIEQGADFVEPDLVATHDGALVCRHENEISGTTDIAGRPEFAARRTTKAVNGQSVSGWFTEDLTLAEVKSLRARERLPELRPSSAEHDGRHEVATFDELVALVEAESRQRGRPIGIVAELKHAHHFEAAGLPLDRLLLAALWRHGITGSDPFFIESFEPTPLERLRTETDVRLIQLIEAQGAPPDKPDMPFAQMVTRAGLAHIRTYADGIGPAKALIVPRAADASSLAPTRLVADAHAAGLLVFPWTFRSENFFLALELRRSTDLRDHGDAAGEYRAFAALGVDAMFSDFPADAVAALRG